MRALLKIVIALVLLGGIAFAVYVAMHKEKFLVSREILPRQTIKQLPEEPVKKRVKPVHKDKPLPESERRVLEADEPEPVLPPPPPPKKKTVEEMRREAAQALSALSNAVATSRSESAKPLTGFSGVKFGEVASGTRVRRQLLSADEIADVMYGTPVSRPFQSFKAIPILYVTPKTHQVFRIELEQMLKPTPDGALNPATTNVIALLEAKFKRKALSVDAAKIAMAEREFIFPMGTTTLTLGEYGGERLMLSVESSQLRALVKGETEALREEALAVSVGSVLSKKYPNGGMASKRFRKLNKATPTSFCGVVFGTLAPYEARPVDPRNPLKGFYLDYRQAGCRPFMGFDHGRCFVALTDRAVHTVLLYSDGSAEGLDDGEYFEKVSKSLTKAYKQEFKEVSTAGGVRPSRVWTVGDLKVTLSAEVGGGFSLKSYNSKYDL